MTDGDNNKDDELVRVIRDQSGAERERETGQEEIDGERIEKVDSRDKATRNK